MTKALLLFFLFFFQLLAAEPAFFLYKIFMQRPLSLLQFGQDPTIEPLLENTDFIETIALTAEKSPLGPKFFAADLYAKKSGKDPSLVDSTYVLELKEFIEEICTGRSFEAAIIHPCTSLPGDLVQEMFDKVPVIIVTNTKNFTKNLNWKKISPPSNYLLFQSKENNGLCVWVEKSKTDIIYSLDENFVFPSQKKLRIFFSNMHHDVTKSLALACRYLGHTLIMPGESFSPDALNRGPKIAYGKPPNRREYPYDEIEIIENQEIFKNPPDVLFVSCEEVERDILEIWQRLKNNRKTRLAYYSGNHKSRYNFACVRNLLATDATTIDQCYREKLHYAFWIPWIDWSCLPYKGPSDSLHIHCYIKHLFSDPSRTPSKIAYLTLSQKFIKNCGSLCSFHLPDTESPEKFFCLLDSSSATFHPKTFEGFGYNIIQSLAKGRPVFLPRPYFIGLRAMQWCIEGKTALFFDNYQEFETKMKRFCLDKEFRHEIQQSSAEIIRKIINNEQQARILDYFLQNLQ
ncbi:MAG: hypothetical protein Tsb0015_13590 [Simkaniaceae bacterium]